MIGIEVYVVFDCCGRVHRVSYERQTWHGIAFHLLMVYGSRIRVQNLSGTIMITTLLC